MTPLDIAQVAQRSASVGRRGLRRLFAPEVLERLALIALWRTAGFSLQEIALMFAPDGKPRIERHALAAKAEQLDKTVRELTVIRDRLRHAAACPAPSHLECPSFRRYLHSAVGPPKVAQTRHGPKRRPR